jgi:LAO/AO transport system ATPase
VDPAEHPLLSPVLARDRRSIARAITAVEVEGPESEGLRAGLARHVGRAHVIGITGAPGTGKSTLINALLGELLARGRKVGVVAVDPSSPVTGGAVLGDRVRMGEHGSDDRVFIRSVASRGHLGGVSRQTSDIIDVLDAAGFDTIVVETVGTGQSEVEIAGLADTKIVVCAPGLGDDVQAIKAGILEIADILVVNKGDSPLAQDTERSLREMLRLRRRAAPWEVRVLRTTATTKDGVAALADAIEAHAAHGGRGRRFRGQAAVTADDRAAVDRALAAHRAPQRFLSTRVRKETVEATLAAARPALGAGEAPPWRVYALAGEPLARLVEALRREGWSEPDSGAPLALIFTATRPLGRSDWLACGMHIEALLAAAQARGLATFFRSTVARHHDTIERELALGPNEIVIAAVKLGYPDPEAARSRATGEREPAAGFARFLGFD